MQQRGLHGRLAELLQNGGTEMEPRNRILPLQVSYVLYVHVTVLRNKFLFNKTNKMHEFPKYYFVKKHDMFRAFPLPIVMSFLLYIRHWYISCRFDDSFQAGSS